MQNHDDKQQGHGHKHGPSVHSTADADGHHDQNAVKKTALEAINNPNLEFTPVSEFDGELGGKKGQFKTFFVQDKSV